MRIKQKELDEPDYQYSRYVNGKLAVVQVFSKPCYCVNIIAGKSKSCYPLTEQQYHGYVCECLNWYKPDKEFFLDQANRYIELAMKQKDLNMYQFFLNVALCYYKRAGLNENNPFKGDRPKQIERPHHGDRECKHIYGRGSAHAQRKILVWRGARGYRPYNKPVGRTIQTVG